MRRRMSARARTRRDFAAGTVMPSCSVTSRVGNPWVSRSSMTFRISRGKRRTSDFTSKVNWP